MQRVTYTNMIMTDGQTRIYGVYQGNLCFRKGKPSHINGRTSLQVGQFIFERNETELTYYEMAEAYASPSAPAFDWGRR